MATSRRFGALRLLCAVIAIGPLLPAVNAQIMNCYFFNGTIATNQLKCPDSDACCGRGSTCLSNRLCTDGADYGKKYVRGPCADKEWGPNCPQICKYNENGHQNGWFPRVKRCPNGSLCCDDDPNCCDLGKGVWIDEGGLPASGPATAQTTYFPPTNAGSTRYTLLLSTSTTSSSTLSTTTQSTTTSESSTTTPSSSPATYPSIMGVLTTTNPTTTGTTNSASPAATPPGTESASDNKPLMIGLGVGIALGVLLIAGGTFLAVRALRKRAYAKGAPSALAGPQSEVAQLAGSESGYLAPPSSYGGSRSSSSRNLVEMGSQTHSEMDTPSKGYGKGASGGLVEISDPLHSELDTPPMRQASFYNPNAVELGGQMAVELETPFHNPPGWQQGDPYPRPQGS